MSDSFYFDVRVVQFLPSVVIPLNPVCAGNSFTLNASGGLNYSWTPTNVLSNPLIANPIAKIYSTTNFQVVISDVCGSQTLNVNVVVLPVITSLTNDTTICLGQSVQLKATGGVSYQWSPSTFELSSLNSVSPICTPSQTRKYYVNITSLNGCITKDSVIVSVHQSALKPIVVDSIICIQDSLKLVNSNASSVKFDWSFGDGITSKLFLPTHYYTNPGTYPLKVVFTDTVYCFVKDSILKNIKVNQYYFYSKKEEYREIRELLKKNEHAFICPRALFFKGSPFGTPGVIKKTKRKTIGIHGGSSTHASNKAIPVGFTMKLIDYLNQEGFKIILFGTKKELNEIQNLKNKDIVFASDENIIKNLSLVTYCDFFIGSDSVFKTMASMLKKPTIVLHHNIKNNFRDRVFISPYIKERLMHVYKYSNFNKREMKSALNFISNVMNVELKNS